MIFSGLSVLNLASVLACLPKIIFSDAKHMYQSNVKFMEICFQLVYRLANTTGQTEMCINLVEAL